MKHSKNQRNDSISKAPKAEAVQPDDDEVVALPIDGILDLHTFHPKEIKELVPDYLSECYERGILEVRIIHGKGTGTLRTIVHSILKKNPLVKNFRLGGHGSGSWGATLVNLISENPAENPR